MRNLARLHRVPFIGYWATYSAIVSAMWGPLPPDRPYRMPQYVYVTLPYQRIHRTHSQHADHLRETRHA